MIELKPDTKTVIPVDFSEACTSALKDLLDGHSQDNIHLVHVTAFTVYAAGGELIASEEVDQARREQVQDHAKTFLETNGWSRYSLEVLFGDPGTQIVDYAERLKADLIVVPSHGYHGWRRLILGSVAERIIRMAGCPVLVLRRRDAQ